MRLIGGCEIGDVAKRGLGALRDGGVLGWLEGVFVLGVGGDGRVTVEAGGHCCLVVGGLGGRVYGMKVVWSWE